MVFFGRQISRIKLPLLALPIILASTKKLNKKEWKYILGVYFLTLLILSFASLAKLLGINDIDIIDKRELSINISHIRYGLNFAVAICLIFYFRFYYSKKRIILLTLLAIWFIVCIISFQLYTALICVSIVILIKLFHSIFYKGKLKWKLVSLTILLGIFYLFFSTVSHVYKDYYSIVSLDYDQNNVSYQESIDGEYYWIDKEDKRTESGVYIRRFIAWEELEREWNKRASIDFHGLDLKDQFLSHTITRYLSSKGLKKDSTSISKLSQAEIDAIEKGIANVYYLNHSAIKNRIHKTIYEIDNYKKTGNANGFSIAMRLEYWKTAFKIINKNPILGVGTGDIKDAFQEQYAVDDSVLEDQYRKRSHNQYITIAATFGIVGFIVFILILFIPLFYLKEFRSVYICFFTIALLSFITEDTLETQAGVTLFAFFNCILLLNQSKKQLPLDTE